MSHRDETDCLRETAWVGARRQPGGDVKISGTGGSVMAGDSAK